MEINIREKKKLVRLQVGVGVVGKLNPRIWPTHLAREGRLLGVDSEGQVPGGRFHVRRRGQRRGGDPEALPVAPGAAHEFQVRLP